MISRDWFLQLASIKVRWVYSKPASVANHKFDVCDDCENRADAGTSASRYATVKICKAIAASFYIVYLRLAPQHCVHQSSVVYGMEVTTVLENHLTARITWTRPTFAKSASVKRLVACRLFEWILIAWGRGLKMSNSRNKNTINCTLLKWTCHEESMHTCFLCFSFLLFFGSCFITRVFYTNLTGG